MSLRIVLATALGLPALALTAVTSIAFAQVPQPPQPIQVQPAPTPTPMPPQPIGESTLRYSQLKPRFDQGLKTNEASLTGSWKAVAQATTAACGNKLKDRTSAKGLKNEDGSAFATLVFARHPLTSLPGETQSAFGVSVLGMGKKGSDQGPYKANDEEPQFSTWVYNGAAGLDKEDFYSWTCRGDAQTQDLLVCSVTLVLVSKTKNRCTSDTHGILIVYQKEQAN